MDTVKINKQDILSGICYTELVYGRINKKLKIDLSKAQIQHMIYDLVQKTPLSNFQKVGKNYYVTCIDKAVRITINSSSYRIITVDRLKGR